MENLVSRTSDKIFELECLFHGEFTPYFKTAGTVLLGWLIVSWIWHILLMLFAPAVVSALAIFLICPTTLEWFLKQLGPAVQDTATHLVEKLGLSMNIISVPFM